MSALQRLASDLRAEGGALAAALTDAAEASEPAHAPARRAASGPRTAARAEDYAVAVEAIREGYLLHYGDARVLHPPDDDLALLSGDRLYALGLARLVDLGDVVAVSELADVIGLAAVAQAAGDGGLAEAVWAAGAQAIGWGTSEAHGRAKALAGAGDAKAADALRATLA